jgi:signal transduction histidine kinase
MTPQGESNTDVKGRFAGIFGEAAIIPAEAAPDFHRSLLAADNISALGEMTRGIAHDFRNVLAMLASGLNIAEANADEPEKLKLALAAIHEGVARGLKITNRLLAFARRQELAPGVDDINALLTALKPLLSYGAGPDTRLVLDLAPDLPRCMVDPPQLNAAILNLVVNARDAMPDGGVIEISTSLARRGRAGVAYVRVRVRDHGSGMPPDVLAHIFDPFFTTKGERGTGLGVPQVQGSMKQVGGSVSVRSRPGKGTRFDLYFPALSVPSARADTDPEIARWADEGGAIAPPVALEAAR